MSSPENPLSAEAAARLAFRFSGGVTWESLLAKLARQSYTGAIVGGRGSGKTLLLEQMKPHLEAMGFQPVIFRLSSESSLRDKERLAGELRAVVKPGFILLDGAEQLSTRLWLPVRAAASTAAGLVVTVHRVSRLPTLIECETNPALLRDLVQELVGETLSEDDSETLLVRHRGSIREALGELREWWDQQGREAEGEPEVSE